MLAGFGATAFGIASSMPDPSDLPRRVVTEMVVPQDIPSQLEALAAHGLDLYRSETTRTSDTVDSLLRRVGVSDPQAAVFLRSDAVARKLLEGRAGKMLRVRADGSGRLEELVARSAAVDTGLAATHFTRLRITRQGDQLSAVVETAPMATQIRLGSGTIRTSLFAATDEANIPDAVATQMAEVFSTDIDFHRELRKGDTFSVVYEALTADGEPVTWGSSSGRMLGAEFVNNGRTESALWFQDAAGKGAYYGLDGRSKRRAFLASPLEFSRVTSGFAMRLHPIFNNWRQHNGIDYGAPQGTPVRSVGDGTVAFAGWRNGYGNVVELQHGGARETVYAHLSRIDVRAGQRIEQGERLGAVGRTGWATGPHLHFEFKVNGAHQDPTVIAKTAETATLSASARDVFGRWAASMKGQLDVAGTLGAGDMLAE